MIKKFNIFLGRIFTARPALIVLAAALALAGCASVPPVLPKGFTMQEAVTAPASSLKSFPDTERLVYRITWMGITAGELVCEIKGKVVWQGRLCYLLEVRGRTLGFVATFYKMDDVYRSYVDAEHLYPLRYEEHRHEGGYHKDAVTDLDHVAGKAWFRNAADHTEKTYDIPSGVQDNVSAAYLARLWPLEPGKVFTAKIASSEKVYDLYLSVSRREKVRGRPALHLVPFAWINGREFREGRASGYVSDDAQRTPFLVVIKAPVFTSVTAVLAEQPAQK